MSHFVTRHLKSPVAELGGAPRRRNRARRLIAILLAMAALLPMALSPTHPLAVYGFLVAVYFPPLSSPVHAVTCSQDGTLNLAPIRTWNSMLPDALPEKVRAWLDRKEFPYLADEVALWLDGQRMIAMGHYHVYGGPPSRGDRLAQFMSSLPEVVVSNGVIPLVYLEGEIIPYGPEVEITHEVFRAMRAVESGLAMEVGDFATFSERPSPVLRTVLSHLRYHRNVDITQRRAVAQELENLCLGFKKEYSVVFRHGYTLSPYAQNSDHTRMLLNLAALHGWATFHAMTPDFKSQGS